MKTKEQIEKKLAELKADERHHYEPALVDVNAPLALIQVEIDSKISALKWVLKP